MWVTDGNRGRCADQHSAVHLLSCLQLQQVLQGGGDSGNLGDAEADAHQRPERRELCRSGMAHRLSPFAGRIMLLLGIVLRERPLQDLSPKVKNWNALVVEWLGWMESVSLCDFWLTHWFDIFARLAKYDTQGSRTRRHST